MRAYGLSVPVYRLRDIEQDMKSAYKSRAQIKRI